jgi:hypothetical protein
MIQRTSRFLLAGLVACSTAFALVTMASAEAGEEYDCCICKSAGQEFGVKMPKGMGVCSTACSANGGAATGRRGVCPVPKYEGRAIPGPAVGSNDGSYGGGIGGNKGADYGRERCDLRMTISPLVAKAGQSLTVTASGGNLGTGYANVHSGGLVEWGDGKPDSPFKTVPSQYKPYEGIASSTQSFTHLYDKPGRYVIRAWIQGDFKDNFGSWRCRAQRQDYMAVE